jgi:hypothetical protein
MFKFIIIDFKFINSYHKIKINMEKFINTDKNYWLVENFSGYLFLILTYLLYIVVFIL